MSAQKVSRKMMCFLQSLLNLNSLNQEFAVLPNSFNKANQLDFKTKKSPLIILGILNIHLIY